MKLGIEIQLPTSLPLSRNGGPKNITLGPRAANIETTTVGDITGLDPLPPPNIFPTFLWKEMRIGRWMHPHHVIPSIYMATVPNIAH
jgi:hypothetical protein